MARPGSGPGVPSKLAPMQPAIRNHRPQPAEHGVGVRPPPLAGCEPLHTFIRNDGSCGVRQVRPDGRWVSLGIDQVPTPRKRARARRRAGRCFTPPP